MITKNINRLVLAFLLAFPTSLFAQTVAQDLAGLGMPPEQADYLAGILPSGSIVGNNTWTKGRNAANSDDINMFKLDTSDNLIINSSASDLLVLQMDDDEQRIIRFNATSDTVINMNWGDSGTTAGQTLNFFASTSDGDDDYEILLGGGGASDSARGGYFVIDGNEVATTGGSIVAQLGNASTANLDLRMEHASSAVRVRDATTGGLWEFQNDGDLASDATNGGDVILAAPGKYVRAAVYVPTPVATPVLGTNLVKPGLNVVPTAAANTAMWLGASTPVPGEQFMIYNNAGAAVRIKGAGAAVINGGTAGKYIEMGVGSYMECKTLTTAIQQCPFYTVNGVVAAMPTPA